MQQYSYIKIKMLDFNVRIVHTVEVLHFHYREWDRELIQSEHIRI